MYKNVEDIFTQIVCTTLSQRLTKQYKYTTKHKMKSWFVAIHADLCYRLKSKVDAI